MKKVTINWLTEKGACVSDSEKLKAEQEFNGDILKIVPYLISEHRLADANWLLTKYFNKKQNVLYAIFATEQVLDIFEKKYPSDKRPRKAIEAAKNYLKNPCKETKDAAYAAAAASAYAAAAAAYAAAAASAYAAAAAAYAAAYAAADAAYAAAYAAADAAYAAAYAAADAAYAAAYAAADTAVRVKIIEYGLSLFE
jgi:hypothetical protein